MASTCRRTASTPPEPCESPMSELWIVCGIVFAGVVLAVQALYRLVVRAQRDRSAIKRRLASSAGGGAERKSVDILRQERGLANFDHPRLAALNEFLAQTGLRISVARARTVDGVACARRSLWRCRRFSPICGWPRRRLGRRLAGCRRLFGDRSPTADRSLHRSTAGRAQHHRAQLAHRPPVRERHWTCRPGKCATRSRPNSP